MTVRMNKPHGGTGKRIGWLIWWTIHQGTYDETKLRQGASAAQIPQWMVERIKGRNAKSAWAVGTQLGAKGVPSANLPTEDKDTRARYLVRDIDLETPTRAIVREVLDRYEERVSSGTVALVRLWMDTLTSDVMEEWQGQGELARLITDMTDGMNRAVGKVGDAKARSLLLDYLGRRHRICVRGSGGVYLVPRPSDPALAKRIERELLALRDWVSGEPLNSLFSIVELTEGGATTMDVFVQSAVEELRHEIEDVEGRLDEWKTNTSMNAGSRGFSAGEMAKRCDAIAEKMAVLEDALGEEVGITRAMLDLVRGKAEKMQRGANISVGKARAKREKEAGKVGTAKARAKEARL